MRDFGANVLEIKNKMPYDIILGRNESDKKSLGNKGLIYLGKGYVKMGQYTSLSNRILMDVVRSHVVLVAGKRGSGKCLHGDTLISLVDGSQIPIKDLENDHQRVISLNNELKIESSEKSEFFSREVNKLLKIKLRSGKEIKLTPEHPLLTIKGWKPVQDLNIGSRIATPRITPYFGNNEMPEHEVKLLSYLLAEGHTKSIVLFSNYDEKIISDFRESLNKFDPTLNLIEEKKGSYRISSPNWKNEIISSNDIRNSKGQFTSQSKNIFKKRSIRELIERDKMFGLLATEKFLSDEIIQLKKEQLSLFLNRLFSCDGSIYKVNDYWEISYSSSSNKLIKQIQSLLLRYGILSKLRDKKIKNNNKEFKSFELVINSENSIKFIQEIGFFGEKEIKQEMGLKEIISKVRNPNIDTIPREIWETYKPRNWAEIGREMGYKHPKAMRERINYSPSRQTLLQIAKIENHNLLFMLASSDIFWDEIISIELLEEKTKVYDICVPKNHNFIANDIIVHNSYTLGVIAEELSNLPKEVSQNIAPLIFDTMGIYWTMKHDNHKDKALLQEWNLSTKKLPVRVYVPFGQYDEYVKHGISVDDTFALDVKEMDTQDWILTFGLNIIDPVAILIEKSISRIKEKKSYDIDTIIEEIRNEKESSSDIKNAAIGLFQAANTWGIFSRKDIKPTSVSDLTKGGITTVLDLSVYNSIGSFNVRALVISLISRKIFNQRMSARRKEEVASVSSGLEYGKSLTASTGISDPLVWILIDEAHEFLPLEGKTLATDALVQLLREGRQPGISLVLATQQPGQIHRDVMTQSDIVIAHRVTSQPDITALNLIMQTYLQESINQYMNDLPDLKGSAIILDDNSERIYPIRVRPRFTWHGGEAPTAISF